MGVSGASLGISGREDSVNQDKGTDDLGGQSNAGAVPVGQLVGPTSVPCVVRFLESLDQPNTGDCTKALRHHVHHSTDQRHLAGQE